MGGRWAGLWVDGTALTSDHCEADLLAGLLAELRDDLWAPSKAELRAELWVDSWAAVMVDWWAAKKVAEKVVSRAARWGHN